MPVWRGESLHILMQRANSVNFIPVLGEFHVRKEAIHWSGWKRSKFQPCSHRSFLQ